MIKGLIFLVLISCLFVIIKAENWAVLIAGSNGYFNYRHQADISHAYQLVKRYGIAEDHIITFMYDDIANNEENPIKGTIINEDNGPNVYPGTNKIDYKGNEVTPENFLKVLSGSSMKGIGSEKTLKSTKEDKVFIYFSDHGAPYLLAFPGFNVLHAKDLIDTLNKMFKEEKYKEILFYIEACESGSMFDQILPNNIKIYGETAANPFQSSYACDYNSTYNAYLSDCYSINWMDDSEKNMLKDETIKEQYQVVRNLTKSTSEVCQYGDFSFINEPLISFQGNAKRFHPVRSHYLLDRLREAKNRLNGLNSLQYNLQNSKRRMESAIDSRLVKEVYLQKKLQREQNPIKIQQIKQELQQFKKEKLFADLLFSHLSETFKLYKIREKYNQQLRNDPFGNRCNDQDKIDLNCMKSNVMVYEKHCGKFNEYSIRYASYLRDACKMKVSVKLLDEKLSEICGQVKYLF
ncbi:hypothetical protein ABK040_015082 [Willaertia magna]